MGMGLYLKLWVRGRGGRRREGKKWRDYTPDPRCKEILGRTSFLEVYFRSSKVHGQNTSVSGYGFLCQIALKRTYEHMGHEITK
jgi:hypothetical protein